MEIKMRNDGKKYIKIRGAREHNLKNIDIEIIYLKCKNADR